MAGETNGNRSLNANTTVTIGLMLVMVGLIITVVSKGQEALTRLEFVRDRVSSLEVKVEYLAGCHGDAAPKR